MGGILTTRKLHCLQNACAVICVSSQAQLINDWVWYEGSKDEAQRAAIRRQSEAVIIIGGMVKSHGNEDAGMVIESAGVAGSSATSGKDYTAEIEFTCQAV